MDFGILSIIPPIVAIVLAIKTKQVLISLFSGIYSAEFILCNFHPVVAINNSITRIISIFAEPWVVYTIFFSFMVGAVLTLIQASGGVEGFINYLTIKTKTINNKKRALLLAFVLGIVLFIENSIKILIAGVITRPLTDKYKVSREKLAFVCDSTAASMCALIPLNGWGATLIGLISVQIGLGVISGNPVEILLKSLPYQFYSIVAVISTYYYIKTNKDWGPMKKAEVRALTTGKLIRDGATPLVSDDTIDIKTKQGIKPNMYNMILPIIVMVIMMPIMLYYTGDGDILKGNGSKSIFCAVLLSIIFSAILYLPKKIFTLTEFMNNFYKGVGGMVPVASILIFAFTIGNSITELGTGNYLASIVENQISGNFAPAIIFILGSIIAFSTGTSWGTFAILIPIAVQMSISIDADLHMCIGAVVSGAIMGDHCSPISDTTILASMATASDHIDHVNTQIPYVLLSAGITLVMYIIAGFLF